MSGGGGGDDRLMSLPPGIYYGQQSLILGPRRHDLHEVTKRILYAWNTLNAAHHGRLSGPPKQVSDLCVLCRKLLDSAGLRHPSHVATGG